MPRYKSQREQLLDELTAAIRAGDVLSATYARKPITAGPYQTATSDQGGRYALIIGGTAERRRSPRHVAQGFLNLAGETAARAALDERQHDPA
jgi:hypothetical protein